MTTLLTNRKTKPLTYLASPYSDPDKYVMDLRHRVALKAVCYLLHRGEFVYSPIVHNHPVIQLNDLGRGWDVWEEYDLCMLSRCDSITVLTLPGWDKSIGVSAEMQFARDNNMPIHTLSPYDSWNMKDWGDCYGR